MSFIQEFKEFAVRGNVVDLAVGVIIGGAFGKIITSLVSDIIMPPIGLLMGGVNFTDLKWVLKAGEMGADGKAVEAVSLNYGNFLQFSLDFLIVAFSIFLLVKTVNHLKKEEIPAVAPLPLPTPEELILMEIRDILRSHPEAVEKPINLGAGMDSASRPAINFLE